MSKIFKRESLQSKGRKLKVDNNRKRNIIVNFRMSPEEKSLLEEKIALSGLNKQDYMIQISLNHRVEVFGNIRVFDELKTKLKMLEDYFKNESYGAYFGGGFGAALIDAVDVEHASQEKLLEIAKSRGIEVDKYEIRNC